MATIEEYAKQPVEQRLLRMSRTADEIAAAIKGQSDEVLSRRPDEKNWAAKEVICHLRDVEEVYLIRARTIIANDVDTKMYANPSAADRWAEDRQYRRSDATDALRAFRRWREESLGFLKTLAPAQLERGSIHPTQGRLTIDRIVTSLAWHDDNHLDQLKRALDGKA
jgi:hypothetical protein